MAPNYGPVGGNSPYGSGDPYYNESSGFITPHSSPKRSSNFLKFGIPVAVIVIAGAVIGGVIGTRASKHNLLANSGGGGTAVGGKGAQSISRYAYSTSDPYLIPVYPSTTNTALFTTPTFNTKANTWPSDTFQPQQPNVLNVRSDRPRLIAPSYKWQALPTLIKSDPYLRGWNDTIFGNASAYYPLPPVVYNLDGGNGILDNAREIKMRIKAFAYVYRMTNDTKWVDRTWMEILNAAGNGTSPFGPAVDKWNSVHFLDTAEMTAAFAIAYDWLYDVWKDDQKSAMRTTMIEYGLQLGVNAVTNDTIGWWRTNTTGNWNCVCNGGLTLGALAIFGDDTTGVAQQILSQTVDNAKQNCALAVTSDGTWVETANYWYFGTTGHAEMSSALLTATGSDYGLLDTNPNFYKTGLFHMYVFGPTSLFDFGDSGPNKFSTTANAMFLYGSHYAQPQYTLFQREQHDAAEPWSMFWYDPSVQGAYWDGAPLDAFFDDPLDQWASMRSSWTDNSALYVAIKAGALQGHQTHNDLDVGDFVLDALGTRWAGEFGNSDYNSPYYFSNDSQNSARWEYFRKMTEGQNTILLNQTNQNVLAQPSVQHGTTNVTQGSSTVLNLPNNSTAYWITDMSSAYFGGASVKRGLRLLNGRRQVLLQDEITTTSSIQWRINTNATVTVGGGGSSATLKLAGQTLTMSILSPSGASFTTMTPSARLPSDPIPPAPDPPNPGVTTVIISLSAGTQNIQVLFNPQWHGMPANAYVTPPSVALADWSLESLG